jgi:hypothetical protein
MALVAEYLFLLFLLLPLLPPLVIHSLLLPLFP